MSYTKIRKLSLGNLGLNFISKLMLHLSKEGDAIISTCAMLLRWLQAGGNRAETQQYLLDICCLWAGFMLDTDSHGRLMMTSSYQIHLHLPDSASPTPFFPSDLADS